MPNSSFLNAGGKKCITSAAGLDPRTRRTLINLLRKLLITKHDMRLAQELFPRTIVLDEGRVVTNGLTMEILENKELLTAHGMEKPSVIRDTTA